MTADTLTIKADALHNSDILILKDKTEQRVTDLHYGAELVYVVLGEDQWSVPKSYVVTVADTRECPHCSGKGVYYGRGHVENGRFIGYTGPCYPCAGKGMQDRKDRIRTATYWAKYARISA